MHFESVTAHSFGPLSDETLRFGAGFTIVHGPNESGKSCWHAALYAAFCGMRRGAGLRSEDREFTRQHKPWTTDAWEVGAVLTLNDGRRIELRNDLAGKVDCAATDEVLGTDVSDEIINEGSPDGSVWLGLDRRSFLATACVKQTDLLSILKDPNVLQEHLQRAAATGGADATAAAAISALERFRKERVGVVRANSTKPLAQALRRVDAAAGALEQARSQHEAFLEFSAQAQEARDLKEKTGERLRLTEAVVAAERARKWQERLEEAETLMARHPAGPPPGDVEDDEIVREVAAAISAWRGLPGPVALEGPSSSDLREQIEALPDVPKGDLKPHAEVTAARNAYYDAERALEQHLAVRPTQPEWPETVDLSAQDLRDLAHDLEPVKPEMDASLQERLEQATRRVEQSSTETRIRPVLVAGIVLILLGIATLVLGATGSGLLLLVVGGGTVVVASVRGSKSRVRALEDLRDVENQAGKQRHTSENANERRAVAREKCAAYGLEPDPTTLKDLADALWKAERDRQDLQRWTRQHEDLSSQREEAAASASRALSGRGADVGHDLRQSLEDYVEACARREQVADRASRHQVLSEQLSAREAAEKVADDAQRMRVSAEAAVRNAASRCGVNGEEIEEVVCGLQDWQESRSASLEAQQEAREEWTRIETLLGGRTIDELRDEATRRRETAADLARDAKGDPAVVALETDVEAQLSGLRRAFEEASAEAARLEGKVDEQARGLPSVPEAEEALVSAERERDRVRRLDNTLGRTFEFLRDAEQKVHRDVAPVLAATVRRWLPQVTSGRYVDARVDPESLVVRVKAEGRSWREAARLSHGTAEQIYLLLRIAVVEHLTKRGETCPLILDDVTAQSDESRTVAMLDMLHQVSETRQVILFSQEREVLEWAQANLKSPQDGLVSLHPETVEA